MPAGRPTLYDPNYCAQVIEDMAQGYSMTAFAGKIGVCRDTLQEWAAVQPEFSAALKNGKSARTRFLETGLLGEEIGPRVTARIFALKNAAPDEWRDRHEVSGPDGGPIQVSVSRFTPDVEKLTTDSARSIAGPSGGDHA